MKLRRNGSKPENPRKRCGRGGLIAWFMHDEGKRWIARSGQDRGVGGPVENYILVSVDQVGWIESVVTMVGPKVVFAADRIKKWEQ